jgi:hypothetical protein
LLLDVLIGNALLYEIRAQGLIIMRKMRIYALTAVFVGGAIGANAQLIVYDGFDYTAGSALNGASGGVNGPAGGWVNNWTSNSAVVTTGGLQSPAAVAPPVGNAAVGNAQRDFSLGPFGQGDTLYFSYLLKSNNGNSGTLNFNVDFAQDHVFTIGTNGGAVSVNSPGATSGLLPVSGLGNASLLIGKITIDSWDTGGTLDASTTFTAYTVQNPDAGYDALTNPLVQLSSGSDTFIYIGALPPTVSVDGGLTQPYMYDEIRFGRSLSDVVGSNSTQPVPEPATLAVLALGAFSALRKRRSS